jgi:rhodanese-related sulfurtransferase
VERPKTIDELLAEARATLPTRLTPEDAAKEVQDGALLIDIRGDDQRRADGRIPGATVLPRNSLEWRCDPASEWRDPAITRHDQRLILICNEGFQSSLAAATLQRIGLRHATDVDGGFVAWKAAGLPVVDAADGTTGAGERRVT